MRNRSIKGGRDTARDLERSAARTSDLSGEVVSARWRTQPLDRCLGRYRFCRQQSGGSRRVLVVSQGNVFLEQLLAAVPDLQAFRAVPQKDRLTGHAAG